MKSSVAVFTVLVLVYLCVFIYYLQPLRIYSKLNYKDIPKSPELHQVYHPDFEEKPEELTEYEKYEAYQEYLRYQKKVEEILNKTHVE